MNPLLVLSTNVILIGILWKLCDIYKILKEVKRKDSEKKCDHIWVNMDRTLMIWKCEKCGIISNV